MRYNALLLLLFAFAICRTHACAQEDTTDDSDGVPKWLLSIMELPEPDRFEGRIFVGLNCTQLDGDTQAGFHKAGLSAGGAVYVHIKRAFSVSMELLYSQKGVRGANVKESAAWGTYFDKYYLNLDYAEAALLLHIDRVLGYEAGISYGRLIRAQEWAEADVPIIFVPDYGYFNSYDLSYVGGLYLRFRKRWRINARYQYSALTVRPSNRAMPRYSNGHNQFNELFSFRLVYTL